MIVLFIFALGYICGTLMEKIHQEKLRAGCKMCQDYIRERMRNENVEVQDEIEGEIYPTQGTTETYISKFIDEDLEK